MQYNDIKKIMSHNSDLVFDMVRVCLGLTDAKMRFPDKIHDFSANFLIVLYLW